MKALNAKGLADLTQGELNGLEEVAKSLGAKGLAFIKVEGGEWKSPIVKFFSEAEKAELTQRLGIADGDIIFFAAAPWEKACAILGRIRLECAALLQKRGKLSIPADEWKFLWVVDFPLMTFDEEEKRYMATHHPFTAPVPEDIPLLDSDPRKVRGQHYDVVLNGMRAGRRLDPHPPAGAAEEGFRGRAARSRPKWWRAGLATCCAHSRTARPPHGGIAFGLDRIWSPCFAARRASATSSPFPRRKRRRI